jgi:tetratricopeptide (TPR) repeat protein
MNIKTKLLSLFSIVVLCFSVTVKADEHADSLAFLQQKWAEANYQLQDEKQKAQAFENLLVAADKAVAAYPNAADMLIWRGIIKSTFAGVKGGLGALSLVKSSREDLEHALDIEPTALDGSAYTSLGTLYFKVPGWPISFGDDDEAEKLLKTALAINPEGIDQNFFYAQYLMDQGKYKDAKIHLLTASNAKPRVGREVADQGRKLEISHLLKEVDAKLL